MTGSDADASVVEPEILDITPQMLFPSMSDMVEKRPKGISRNDWFQNRCASMTSRQDMTTVRRDRQFRCCSLLQQVVDRWLDYRGRSMSTKIAITRNAGGGQRKNGQTALNVVGDEADSGPEDGASVHSAVVTVAGTVAGEGVVVNDGPDGVGISGSQLTGFSVNLDTVIFALDTHAGLWNQCPEVLRVSIHEACTVFIQNHRSTQ